ncbi:MAG: DUF559 domain-containing protein [Actinomycetota bacterium]|nr:DUF559 domain-containing protein [Actinomycetota bacterium]
MSIVDFVCLEKRIVVEVDGGQHQKEKDRDKDIEDNEVLKNTKRYAPIKGEKKSIH